MLLDYDMDTTCPNKTTTTQKKKNEHWYWNARKYTWTSFESHHNSSMFIVLPFLFVQHESMMSLSIEVRCFSRWSWIRQWAHVSHTFDNGMTTVIQTNTRFKPCWSNSDEFSIDQSIDHAETMRNAFIVFTHSILQIYRARSILMSVDGHRSSTCVLRHDCWLLVFFFCTMFVYFAHMSSCMSIIDWRIRACVRHTTTSIDSDFLIYANERWRISKIYDTNLVLSWH
jgi:hypothetical protein